MPNLDTHPKIVWFLELMLTFSSVMWSCPDDCDSWRWLIGSTAIIAFNTSIGYKTVRVRITSQYMKLTSIPVDVCWTVRKSKDVTQMSVMVLALTSWQIDMFITLKRYFCSSFSCQREKFDYLFALPCMRQEMQMENVKNSTQWRTVGGILPFLQNFYDLTLHPFFLFAMKHIIFFSKTLRTTRLVRNNM